MMGMKTDWIQSACSFMWHNEIMNWWGPVPVKPMEEVIYQVNCIAVTYTFSGYAIHLGVVYPSQDH